MPKDEVSSNTIQRRAIALNVSSRAAPTEKPMQKPLFFTLKLALLSVSLPLFFTTNAWARTCTESEIIVYVREADDFTLTECNTTAIPILSKALRDGDETIRRNAINALIHFGQDAESAIPNLINALSDENAKVRSNAAHALGVFNNNSKEIVSHLIEALKDESAMVRGNAARGLDSFEMESQIIIPALIETLNDENPTVRWYVVTSLSNFGAKAKDAAPIVIEMLKDENSIVRSSAAYALYEIGLENKTAIPGLIEALKDENEDVRASAAYTLGGFGTQVNEAEIIVPNLIRVLQDQSFTVRKNAAISLQEIAETLSFFEQAETLTQVEDAIAVVRQIRKVIEGYEFEDVTLRVDRSLDALQDKRQLLLLQVLEQWLSTGRKVWFVHAVFWLVLIYMYPKSPQVQAIFFWNPWVRKIMGLGYVGFVLTWVPFLRRSLFAPFRDSLLADAGLENFKPEAYFENSTIKHPTSGEIVPIRDAIAGFKGQLVLEGASGLGKTMFLRHLCQRSQRVVVYLPATKCADGVIEAIQKKLHGEEIKDPKFLQNLIYSGAIAICIDGLNEVSADTRAKIVEFTENYFKGDIILATQPMEWIPPATAKPVVMQPLGRSHIQAFLLSRRPLIPDYAPIREDAYEQSCSRYLEQVLSGRQDAEELDAAQRILSNPMDLTVIASMIAAGKQPDLFRLQEQQYTVMAEEYQDKHLGQEFPLANWSEGVYQMRLKDEAALPEEAFLEGLLCMERHKMVVSRQSTDSDGKPAKEWYFRHDKIAEFFILQTFLEHPERQEQHLGDPRFRGVYFMLANFLKLEDAIALREMLIQYAADTKDHTVSDTFVQLLRSRRAEPVQTAA